MNIFEDVMAETLDSDRAVSTKDDDEFGFVSIAESLAPRIAKASQGDGVVIGLEGSWGSGKSSLMNLIRQQIDDDDNESVHTITIAPWLDGDTHSLIMPLLHQIAKVLELESEKSDSDQLKQKAKHALQSVATYGVKTTRWLSPAVKLLGNVLPGAEFLGKITDSGGDALQNLINEGPSTSELKKIISEQLKEIDHSFIVFLDDLDRLEPEQAVEVVRLVRSVADFPKVAYLMCYDRQVLANGLKVGLNVDDGDLFLQKIVQLTFQIPLLEPLELRQQFLRAAQSIYFEANGSQLEGEIFNDLNTAVDDAGGQLSTPREVKLTLNTIRFCYPSIVDDVYFPHLCWLHLIKTTRYKLYQWMEGYLSARSAIVTRHIYVRKEERAKLGNQLKVLMDSEDYMSSSSITGLGMYVPGLSKSDIAEDCVFRSENEEKAQKTDLQKALGSPAHYRFYFALTGPKTVMPDVILDELLYLAKQDQNTLTQRLKAFSEVSGLHKLKQLLFRLNTKLSSETDTDALDGLVRGFTNVMDLVLKNQQEAQMFGVTLDREIGWLVEKCLAFIGESDKCRMLDLSLWMCAEGKALNWLVGEFFRGQLFAHGRVGNDPRDVAALVYSEGELNILIEAIIKRVSTDEAKAQIKTMPKIGIYMYGWKNFIGDDNAVDEFVSELCSNDIGFLQLLNSLRHQITSDRIYFPLSKASVETFLDWEETESRLENMIGGEFEVEAKDLIEAIALSKR